MNLPRILVTCFFLILNGGLPVFSDEISSLSLNKAADLTNQGTKTLDAGEIDKAKGFYEQALKCVPEFPDAHLGMGHILLKQGKVADALAAYERSKVGYGQWGNQILKLRMDNYKAIRRQVDSLRAQISNLADKLRALRSGASPQPIERQIFQTEVSLRRLEAIQAPTPDAVFDVPGEVFFHIGNAQFRLDKVDEAIASWQCCAAKNPKFGAVHINLTVANWKKGRFEDAKAHLAKATELGYLVNPKMKTDLDNAAATAMRP